MKKNWWGFDQILVGAGRLIAIHFVSRVTVLCRVKNNSKRVED